MKPGSGHAMSRGTGRPQRGRSWGLLLLAALSASGGVANARISRNLRGSISNQNSFDSLAVIEKLIHMPDVTGAPTLSLHQRQLSQLHEALKEIITHHGSGKPFVRANDEKSKIFETERDGTFRIVANTTNAMTGADHVQNIQMTGRTYDLSKTGDKPTFPGLMITAKRRHRDTLVGYFGNDMTLKAYVDGNAETVQSEAKSDSFAASQPGILMLPKEKGRRSPRDAIPAIESVLTIVPKEVMHQVQPLLEQVKHLMKQYGGSALPSSGESFDIPLGGSKRKITVRVEPSYAAVEGHTHQGPFSIDAIGKGGQLIVFHAGAQEAGVDENTKWHIKVAQPGYADARKAGLFSLERWEGASRRVKEK